MWFTQFDKNQSGVLEREQLSELLVYLNPSNPPDDEALDLLMQKAIAIDTTGDGKADTTGISRQSAEAVVHKYSDYCAQRAVLNGIFEEFDTNKNNLLEPDQLRALLEKVSPDFPVTDEDVKQVLEMCDKDHKGAIARDEVLAACATWKDMAKQHEESSTCCVCS